MRLSQFCPSIFFQDDNVKQAYFSWYADCFSNEPNKIVQLSAKAMSNFFIALEKAG